MILAGCAGSSRGRLIEKVSNPTISEREVRAQVNAHLLRYSSMVEFTVYELKQRATNPMARKGILFWRLNGISTCRGAAFLDDPLAAALDCWVLGIQELDYYRSDSGKQIFGEVQAIIVERLESVHLPFQTMVKSWAGENSKIEARIEAFARDHPMANLSYGRESIAPEMAKIAGDSRLSAFAAVRTLDERIQDIAERINIYVQQVPQQVRWTTDLIREDVDQSEEIHRLVQDVHTMNASLQRLSTLEDRLPRMIDEQVEMGLDGLPPRLKPLLESLDVEREKVVASITEERRATLAEVDRQRLDTLAFVKAQREGLQEVLDDKVEVMDRIVSAKIKAVSGVIDGQADRITEEIRASTAQTLRDADEVAAERISQLAWSLFFAGSGLILVFFVSRFFSRRYLS